MRLKSHGNLLKRYWTEKEKGKQNFVQHIICIYLLQKQIQDCISLEKNAKNMNSKIMQKKKTVDFISTKNRV